MPAPTPIPLDYDGEHVHVILHGGLYLDIERTGPGTVKIRTRNTMTITPTFSNAIEVSL